MQATSTSLGHGQDEELHWLALRLVPGLGARNAGKLIERFRTPQAVLRSSRSELEAAGISGAVAQSIASGCAFEDAIEQQRQMQQLETVAISISDPRSPASLRETFDPPRPAQTARRAHPKSLAACPETSDRTSRWPRLPIDPSAV